MGTVLFVQLPPPRFSFTQPPVNIPLAAGFLVDRLLDETGKVGSLSILEQSAVDIYADRGLRQAVLHHSPSVLALTLYVWNVQRSLFLASKVKEELPDTKILVGGPEVTPDNAWVMHHPAVDAGVFGEGESRIQAVLEALLEDRCDSDVPATFFVQGKNIRLNKGHPEPWNLAAGRCPYLQGLVAPSRSGTLFLETVRGCPFKCRYCYYHKAFKSVRQHPFPTVEEALRWAYGPDSGVAELYLMDPSFNVSTHYRDVLALMAQLRNTKDIRGHTELRADVLDRGDPRRLSEAGIASVEVGLQSTNPEALRMAGRTGNIERIAWAVESLKKESIEVTTGIIVGLPGDTPDDFLKTLEWLKRTDAYTVVHPFLLSVLPGTDFRANAAELGLVFDARPPYHVKATAAFSENDLVDAMLACESVFDIELDHIDLPSLVEYAPDMSSERASYVSKWIVDPSKKTWKAKLPTLLIMASDPFIIWFKGSDCDRSEAAIKHIVQAFFDANPHAFVHVVFEYATPPRSRFLQRLAAHVAQPSTYVNKSMQSWVRGIGVLSPSFTIILHDPVEQSHREKFLSEYDGLATIVWDLGVPDEEIICRATTPCLVSAAVKPGSPYGYHVVKTLRKYLVGSPEEVLFRDARLYEFWLRSNNLWVETGFSEQIVHDAD